MRQLVPSLTSLTSSFPAPASVSSFTFALSSARTFSFGFSGFSSFLDSTK